MRTGVVQILRTSVLVAALSFAACGGGDDDTEKETLTATAAPTEPALSALLEDYKTSIVQIVTSGADGDGGGTGIVWENGTQVLTNAHVVMGAATIKVNDPLVKGKQYSAVVVALSACDDIALLRVDRAEGLKPARIGDSKHVQTGTGVIAVGFPGTYAASATGTSLVVTEGIVSRTGASFADSGQKDLLQHTAPINPGNSGGPLLNKLGEVVGINSYTIRGAQAENYAITSAEAIFIAEKLKAGKNVDYIGLRVVTNDEDLAYDEDLPYVDGLAVLATSAGSPATKAKPYPIKSGYTIGFIDGKFIENVGTYCDVLRSHKSGDTVQIQFGSYDSADKPALFKTEVTIE